ncbi:MAG: T9SS type A sorting domain-containing protein [Bacteroidales bacterium]|nr:T9SS type A sorting domain-containing protein [Bacteroidales bacterium]
MKKIISFCFIFLFGSSLLSAQVIKQGGWRDHLSYFSCYKVAEVGDWIYASAGSGLISYNIITQEIRKHSKATGLSDVQISAIAYAEESNYLIVGYVNGNIDLLREGEEPVNISAIKRKIMTADKQINNIYVFDQTAYLSCGFGIVVLNLEKLEIKETYILGESGAYKQVNDVTILNDQLYAATKTGIFSVDLNSINLLDFHNWNHLDFFPGASDEYTMIEVFNNKILTVHSQGDSLFTLFSYIPATQEVNEWDKTNEDVIYDIHTLNDYLTISAQDAAYIYNSSELLVGQFDFYGIRQVIISGNEEVFFASSYGGLLWHRDDETNKYLLVNGPRFSEVSQITTHGDRIWVSSGGPSRLYKHGAAYLLNNNDEWTSFLSDDIPTEKILGNTYKIAIDPTDPEHVFIATYGYGLIEIRNEEIVNIFELGNTEAFADIPENIDIRMSGIDFDSEGNLYFVIDLIPDPLFMIDNEGNWHRPEISNSLLQKQNIVYSDLLVTTYGQIWILSRLSGAVILKDEGDGYYRSKTILLKNQYGNNLSRAFCIEEDKEQNIWIGSNNGPVIYYSPWNIFNTSETSGYQVPFSRNDGTDIIDLLLFSESIFDIVSDGGNRKWMATDQSGVFLISDDGKKILANFTENNSPLLSNGVTGIGINEKNGEVFFATDLGLISYGGTATEGLEEYTNVYVYPNPVRPDYEGPITITGLVSNSIVKITDVSGNLVWETTSLGGQAVWDGKNFDGNKVATGVYLVLLASEDGSRSHSTKLLFLH